MSLTGLGFGRLVTEPQQRWPGGVGGACETPVEMARHTTFRFCVDPTVEQQDVLARHAGAARFAFNQCLRMVNTALTERRANPGGWVGVDRGLSAFAVAATAVGREVARIDDAPKALAAGMRQQQHLAKKLSHKKKDRATAARPLPGLPATTTPSATFAGISCTRCPAS